ncbi:hypothetical protein CYMTET_20210 [Cymbomonas tetramitiformis]|uniref:JmjC domain-containing protein n=1 Tax=Cymbomonas tetramitiformis TaxID=36881 RepID=A0AAE0G562_9CHLO|nr:hypothetical protein CYMTET_20210 [Cymbomonas tetramitiformis]
MYSKIRTAISALARSKDDLVYITGEELVTLRPSSLIPGAVVRMAIENPEDPDSLVFRVEDVDDENSVASLSEGTGITDIVMWMCPSFRTSLIGTTSCLASELIVMHLGGLCVHTEDMDMGALNFNMGPGHKVWMVFPPEKTVEVAKWLRRMCQPFDGDAGSRVFGKNFAYIPTLDEAKMFGGYTVVQPPYTYIIITKGVCISEASNMFVNTPTEFTDVEFLAKRYAAFIQWSKTAYGPKIVQSSRFERVTKLYDLMRKMMSPLDPSEFDQLKKRSQDTKEKSKPPSAGASGNPTVATQTEDIVAAILKASDPLEMKEARAASVIDSLVHLKAMMPVLSAYSMKQVLLAVKSVPAEAIIATQFCKSLTTKVASAANALMVATKSKLHAKISMLKEKKAFQKAPGDMPYGNPIMKVFLHNNGHFVGEASKALGMTEEELVISSTTTKDRMAHRFHKCFAPCTLFLLMPCGIVRNAGMLASYEGYLEVFTKMMTWAAAGYPFHGVIYDKACLALRSLKTGENQGKFPDLEALLWMVDKFHSIGHSETDTFCKVNCDPYRPISNGIVRVLSKERYYGRAVKSINDARGTPIQVTYQDWKRKGGEVVYSPVTKAGRMILMNEPEVGGNGTVTWEYRVVDIGNIEAAEQAFALLGGFSGMLRKMEANFALFFLYCTIDFHNAEVTARLERNEFQPIPSAATMNAMFGRRETHAVDPAFGDDGPVRGREEEGREQDQEGHDISGETEEVLDMDMGKDGAPEESISEEEEGGEEETFYFGYNGLRKSGDRDPDSNPGSTTLGRYAPVLDG